MTAALLVVLVDLLQCRSGALRRVREHLQLFLAQTILPITISLIVCMGCHRHRGLSVLATEPTAASQQAIRAVRDQGRSAKLLEVIQLT